MHLAYSTTIRITIVFDPGEIGNNGYAKFGGVFEKMVNRAFSLTWLASMQIYWNKRKPSIRKELDSPRIGLEHQHGRRYIVLLLSPPSMD